MRLLAVWSVKTLTSSSIAWAWLWMRWRREARPTQPCPGPSSVWCRTKHSPTGHHSSTTPRRNLVQKLVMPRSRLDLFARLLPALAVSPCFFEQPFAQHFLLRLEARIQHALLLIALPEKAPEIASVFVALLESEDLLNALRVVVQRHCHTRWWVRQQLAAATTRSAQGGSRIR